VTPRVRGLSLAAVILAIVGWRSEAQAGPAYSLGRKAECSEAAVEIELAFDRSTANDRLVSRAAAARRTFPDALKSRALGAARVTAVFYGGPTVALPKPLDVYLPDRVWRAAYARGRFRALLFVGRHSGQPRALFGVEGLPNDIDADFNEIRAALLRYARWREGRRGAADVAEAEKLLVTTSNPSVATLAASFLCTAGRADEILRARRTAPPGSPATQLPPEPSCPPPPGNCDW